MTSYGDAHTGRVIVRYSVLATNHRVKFRQIAGTSEATFITSVENFLSSLHSALPTTLFVWGSAEYAAAGSYLYMPVVIVPTVPDGGGLDVSKVTTAYYWNVDVRGTGGGRLAFSLHTLWCLITEDMRLRAGHDGRSDAYLVAYNAAAGTLADTTGSAGTPTTYLTAGIAEADIKKARG
jgi:hypothetical protein